MTTAVQTRQPRLDPSFDRTVWAVPEDAADLRSVGSLFSVTLGTCKICGWRRGEGPTSVDEHLERHRWEASPAGQREYARLTAVLCDEGLVTLRRRLGLLLWRLHDRGKSPRQIARDIRVPLPVVEHALSLPKGQRAGVQHLHHLGLLSREIAERLELPVAKVDRNLRRVDWTLWLERCCPPGWASQPLL